MYRVIYVATTPYRAVRREWVKEASLALYPHQINSVHMFWSFIFRLEIRTIQKLLGKLMNLKRLNKQNMALKR